MTATQPTLFDPFPLGDLTLSNRVALAPMTRARAGESRVANAMMADYYAQRAGAGLLITEATTVSPQANGWVGSPGIYTDAMEQGWMLTTKAVHAAGTPVFLQLWHTGRVSHPSFLDGELPVGPSAIAAEGEAHTTEGKQPYVTPRALRTDELPGIVADYAKAAERAKAAGFDGIEVHSANGYLLDQFLQSRSNQRTDEYGGSLENRFRLLREILGAVTRVFPANRVAVRLSPNGVFNDMGADDYRETFLYAAGELDRFGLAYLHVMDGTGFGFHGRGEPMTLDEFRTVFHGPIMGNVGYTKESATEALAQGSTDLIAFGRPFIANPDLVERLRNDWPLAESDPSQWYSGEETAEGYTDFPTYTETAKA